MTFENMLIYYGGLFGAIIIFYLGYLFCKKKREWGENP